MYSKREAALFWLVGKLGKHLLRLLFSTVRYDAPPVDYRPEMPGGGRYGVYGIWHHSLLFAAHRYIGQPFRAIISRSKDGEYIARIAQELGYKITRGSTTRGGMRALRELYRKAGEEAGDIVFTVDGPKGPRHEVQPGAVYLAQITGLPLTPAAYGVSRCWEAPSWDRFRVPLPFARVVQLVGRPRLVPADATREELDALRAEFQNELRALQEEADRRARA